jgi:hypothetical protein
MLPEWSFLVGISHEGDILQGRTVLLHYPSYTILEVFPISDITTDYNFKGPTFQFQNNSQKFLIYIHCTLSHDVDKIFEETAVWYSEYLDWLEKNSLIEEKSKQN